MEHRAALIAALVACGPVAKPPTNVVTGEKPAPLGTVKVVPCPPAAVERYRQLEHDSFEHVAVDTCIAGAFGDDATIAATISIGPPPGSQAETGTSVQLALISAAGVERARGSGIGFGWLGGGGATVLVVDLDGDGIDEIVQASSDMTSDHIHVVRRKGATLAIDSIPPDRDPSLEPTLPAPLDICELAVKLGDVRGQRTLIVTAKVRDGEPPPDHIPSCDPGEWVYVWERGQVRALHVPEAAPD